MFPGRVARILALLLLVAFTLGTVESSLRAEDDELASALALERTMQKVIERAEPAIACVLVSRSEIYRKLQRGAKVDDAAGQLEGFDPDGADNGVSREQVRKYDLADPNAVPESFGSGVVIDPRGYILTNYHVVRDATKIFVRLPGNRSSYANIHAADQRSDLAILRLLQLKLAPLPALKLGDGGTLKRGNFVLSLANPYAAGFRDGQPSASWGIISNVRRRAVGHLREDEQIRSLHQLGTLLQLDARLNLGCSGGAVLNLRGELVGLTTALAAIQGGETPGGFALPLDAGMRRIVDVLLRGEEVDYGFLGVSFQKLTGDNRPGVVVENPIMGSPAEVDGKLRGGDRILAVGGAQVQDTDDLFLHIGTHLAGSRVDLKVRRITGETQTVPVTLAKYLSGGKKVASSAGSRPYFRGLRVDWSSLLVQQVRLQRIPRGVLVSDVQPNSPAAQANLRPGEVISAVRRQPVSTPAEFYRIVSAAQGPIELTLLPSAEPGSKSIVVQLLPQ